jgi:hypothetical protein
MALKYRILEKKNDPDAQLKTAPDDPEGKFYDLAF